MTTKSKMENSRARFWTRSEIIETLKECVKVGFEVTEEHNIWTAVDPVLNKTVIRALIVDDMKVHTVRVSADYFDL